MKKFSWLLVLVAVGFLMELAVSGPARAISVGDTAPDFSANSALGGKVVPFNLKATLAKHAVVLYFFPKAFTSG